MSRQNLDSISVTELCAQAASRLSDKRAFWGADFVTEKGSKGRFYDLKIRYQRSDLDGTLFEGQVDTSIRLYGWITAQQGVRDITDIMEKYRRGALGLCLIRN